MKKIIATSLIALAAVAGLAGCNASETETGPKATSPAHAAELRHEAKRAQFEKAQEDRREYMEAKIEYFRNGGK